MGERVAGDEPAGYWSGWWAHGVGLPEPLGNDALRGWFDRAAAIQTFQANQRKLEALADRWLSPISPPAMIVHARPPRRIKSRAPAPVIVDRRRPPEHDPQQCAEAAERLWRELVRRVEEAA